MTTNHARHAIVDSIIVHRITITAIYPTIKRQINEIDISLADLGQNWPDFLERKKNLGRFFFKFGFQYIFAKLLKINIPHFPHYVTL